MITNKTRIQNFILDLVQNTVFHPVIYNKDTGHSQIEQNVNLRPGSMLTNEVTSTWARDGQEGTKIRHIRTRWTFELLMAFNREVSLETFEKIFEDGNVIIPPTEDFKQAILEIAQVVVEHPVQQDGKSGTRTRITLNAFVGRQ